MPSAEMRRLLCTISFLSILSAVNAQEAIIADHKITGIRKIEEIPLEWIHTARDSLRIFYHGTSHSAQVKCGLNYILSEYGADYAFHRPRRTPVEKQDTLLFFHDIGGSISCARDLGRGDNGWWTCTRAVLDSFPRINVAFWSFCGGASHASEAQISTYLSQGDAIEKDYPGVRFIYMTGHTDGTGYVAGNDSTVVPTLHRNNEMIRKFCRENEKILFDFADIESHSPDGRDMMALYNDHHKYDIDGDKRADEESNWCQDYCETDPDGCYGRKYDDRCGHTDPLISQLKGEAVWWMLARMVGWEGFDQTGALNSHKPANVTASIRRCGAVKTDAFYYNIRGQRVAFRNSSLGSKAPKSRALIITKSENSLFPLVQ